MLQRVLIANRGAIARRIIRACRKLGIESVCCYSDIDFDTPAIDEADHAARLPGYRPQDTYLNATRILALAKEYKVDSVHPGYGFLAESRTFAEQVRLQGLSFIGPAPDWIERMSEKTRARTEMSERGFPVHQGSDILRNEKSLSDFVQKVGLPVVIKPVGGGGGIGMFVIENSADLSLRFKQATALAGRAFSNTALYAEKYLEKPRHIEFQVIGDGTECVVLGERECSVQRRHQKLIEESPAPNIYRHALDSIESQLIDAVHGYDSVGTVECLFANEQFGFLEMNTRLQVEHGVTEEALGIDLVEMQLLLAGGEKLSNLNFGSGNPRKFSVEARLYAEDSERMLPSTGRLSVFEPPTMEGVRIEASYRVGNHVTPYYDPLLAKIIGTGTTREQAISRTSIALKAFVINGVQTNSSLLQHVLGSEAFILGRIHTELLTELL